MAIQGTKIPEDRISLFTLFFRRVPLFPFPLSPFHFFAPCNAAPHPRHVCLCVYVSLCVVYLFWIDLVRSLQEINLPHTESLGVPFRKLAVHHGALFGWDLVPSTYTKMCWKPHKRATVSNCSRSVTIRREDPTTRPQRIINTDFFKKKKLKRTVVRF